MTASLPWTSSTTSSSSGRPPGQRWVRMRQPASRKRCKRGSSGPVTPGAVTSTVGIAPTSLVRLALWERLGEAGKGSGGLLLELRVADLAAHDQQFGELALGEGPRRAHIRAATEPVRLVVIS